MGIEERLAAMNLELPPPPRAVASYLPVATVGNLAYVSGQVPMADGEIMYPGHVGAEVTLEQAQEAARQCALQALSALKAGLGSAERIARVGQVNVFVASAPGFTDQALVANGASDLLIGVLGDVGRHSRFAVGVAELPLNAPVEVAMVVEVAPLH